MTRGTTAALVLAGAIFVVGCKDKKKPGSDEAPPASTVDEEPQRFDATPVTPGKIIPEPKARLARDTPLSPRARELLAAPMARHVEDVGSMLWDLIMLDREHALKMAAQLAEAPRVSNSGNSSSKELAELFPERFLSLEGEMHAAVAAVVPAVRGANNPELSAALERLTLTCVGCHDVYLRMPASSSLDAATASAPDAVDPLPPDTAYTLDRDDELGAEARLLLQHWMGRHGRDVEELLRAAITLKYDAAYEIASDLALQLEGSKSTLEELGGDVSRQFLELQGEYERRLIRIAEAATATDAAATGEAFASMTATCLRCHEVYLNLRP